METSETYSRNLHFSSYQAIYAIPYKVSESYLSLSVSPLFPLLSIIHLKCFNGLQYHFHINMLNMYSFKDVCHSGGHFILQQRKCPHQCQLVWYGKNSGSLNKRPCLWVKLLFHLGILQATCRIGQGLFSKGKIVLFIIRKSNSETTKKLNVSTYRGK